MKHTEEECKGIHCRCMNLDCQNQHHDDHVQANGLTPKEERIMANEPERWRRFKLMIGEFEGRKAEHHFSLTTHQVGIMPRYTLEAMLDDMWKETRDMFIDELLGKKPRGPIRGGIIRNG